MRVRATFTHPHPTAGADTPAHLVVSVHGDDDPTATTDRPHLAVIPVVDTSGSMSMSGKLSTVTAALTHLSSYLAGTDRIALVDFDDTVRVPVPVRAADSGGVKAFTAALAALRPAGSTNLHGALSTALKAASRTACDSLTRVIVLTDGRANVGPSDAATLTALLSDRAPHVSVSFLGVGTDCDHALLGQLAQAGGGSYGFIEHAADAAGVLGAEVGGLLDADAHQVVVRVTARSKFLTLSTGAALATPGTLDTDPDGHPSLEVPVGTVLRGVTRHVVIPVTLHGPKRPHARAVTVADVHLEAVVGTQDGHVHLRPKAWFTAQAGPVDESLTEAVELAQVAESVRVARELAAAGNFAAARGVVASTRVHTGAASGLLAAMAGSYADASTYNSAAPALSSTLAAVTGTLSGSSSSFDALAARTIGGYQSAAQRRTSSATTAAVTGTRSWTSAPAETGVAAPAPATPVTDDDVDGEEVSA